MMLGQAAIAMWWDIAPQMQPEFEDWHSHEHMPERLGIPGFLRGTRCIAFSGEPSYFILYEAARLSTITGGAYLERLNNPSPWSRKMMPHHANMVRSLCRVRASFGGVISRAMATIRFTPSHATSSLAAQLAQLPERKGLTGAHLLEAQPMPGTQTTEQKIRGKDAQADAVLLICGYDLDAVKAVDFGTLPGAVHGLYSPAYSLASRDLK
jgi:hypothetical protein